MKTYNPKTHVVVPIEPTEKMSKAGQDLVRSYAYTGVDLIYKEMLSAAPEPDQETVADGDAIADELSKIYSREFEKYKGNTGDYYPNNHAAMIGCMKKALCALDTNGDYLTTRKAVSELSGIPMMAATFDKHIEAIKQIINTRAKPTPIEVGEHDFSTAFDDFSVEYLGLEPNVDTLRDDTVYAIQAALQIAIEQEKK